MRFREPFERILARRRIKAKIEKEIREEIEMHIAERTEWLVEQGADMKSARKRAEALFGNQSTIAGDCRQMGYEREGRMNNARFLGSLVQDVRYALRSFRRQPGFHIALVATLALGIGANVSVFSVVDALLLRPLAFSHPEQLISIRSYNPENGNSSQETPFVRAVEFAANSDFVDIGFSSTRSVVRTDGAAPQHVGVTGVSDNLFNILGVNAAIGRSIVPGDDHVVVLSDQLFRRWGSDTALLGTDIVLDDELFTVIGVMPSWFRYPSPRSGRAWVPMGAAGRFGTTVARGAQLIGRMTDGINEEVAQQQTDALVAGMEDLPQFDYNAFQITPLEESRANGDLSKALWTVLGAVSIMLFVAIINAVNLLLARSVTRTRELAIRLSVGGSKTRIIRQLSTETILQSAMGGILGVALVWLSLDVLVAMLPSEILLTAVRDITVDGRTYLYTFGLSVGVGLLAGLLPSITIVRALGTGNLGAMGSSRTGTGFWKKWGQPLVITEVAMSVLLLFAAGLLGKSFLNIVNVDPGFDPDKVIVASLQLSGSRYDDDSARLSFFQELKSHISGLPGVTGVSRALGAPPGSNFRFPVALETEDGGLIPGEMPNVLNFAQVDSEYFDAFGSKVVAGRLFSNSDVPSERSTVIDLDLATKLWGDESPIGRRFRVNDETSWVTVIGVIEELQLGGLDWRASADFSMFSPINPARSPRFMQILIGTDGNTNAVAETSRKAISEIDPLQPIWQLGPLSVPMGQAIHRNKFYGIVMTVFAAVALGLTGIGVFGLLAFAVAQQRRDLSVRMALGARARTLVAGIVTRGLALAVVGCVLGLAVSLTFSKILAGFLFETRPTDLSVLAGVSFLVLTTSGLACFIPARRALRIDPARVLMEE